MKTNERLRFSSASEMADWFIKLGLKYLKVSETREEGRVTLIRFEGTYKPSQGRGAHEKNS